MDHDNKIAPVESTHEHVQLFLGSELQPLEKTVVASYDLVSEYGKTAQHKNRRVWVWLFAVFAIVIVAAVTVTNIVSYQNKKIAISINTFDDLNLRGLLNIFGRTESLYQTAVRQKDSLQDAMAFELEQAKQKRENDLYTVESVAAVTKADVLQKRRGDIDRAYIAAVNAIHETYDPQIAAAEEQLQRYQEQMDTFDSTQVANAQEQEASLDSQKQLHDLEMKVQAERYEKTIAGLRADLVSQQQRAVEEQRAAVEEVRQLYQAKIDLLDPVVRNQHGDDVIRDTAEIVTAPPIAFDAQQYAGGASDAFSRELSTVQGRFDEFDYISAIVAAVPQENTIPSYVETMRKLTHQIGESMAQSAQKLQTQVNELQSAADTMDGHLEHYLQENLADALVLSDTNRTVFPLYVAKAKRAVFAAGTPVDVQIREGKRVIADASVTKQDNAYVLTLKDPKRAEYVAAFQKVYLSVVR